MKKLSIISLILLYILIGCNSEKEVPPKDITPDRIEENVQKIDTTTKVEEPPPIKPEKELTKPPEKKNLKNPSSISEITSISELWRTYKSAKARVNEALETNDLDTIITYLHIAGECAVQLGRPDIASWQFNNIGHYSILEFKRVTDYERRMRELATMNDRNNRTDFINESKKIFSINIRLLLEADKYLEQAQVIDDELEISRRTQTIERNRDFISWVKDFTEESG